MNVKEQGIGEVYKKYDQLKKYYSKKGYFDHSIKKIIPKFPKNIGVITAPTGAAIQDIKTTIKRRYDIANIILFPCIVQGDTAAKSIKKQIEIAGLYKELDVLIIGRGGGSFEDLSSFSEPEVIESIYKCSIPVISAVGHEIDFQLSDFVADKRAATPTAAAEIATPNKEELLKYLNEMNKSLILNIKNCVNRKYHELLNYKKNPRLNSITWLFKDKGKEIEYCSTKINNIISEKISHINNELKILKNNYYLNNLEWIFKDKENKLNLCKKNINNLFSQSITNASKDYENKINILNLINPLNTLLRGYSVVKNNRTKKYISSIKEVKINDQITIRMNDGNIDAKIIKA